MFDDPAVRQSLSAALWTLGEGRFTQLRMTQDKAPGFPSADNPTRRATGQPTAHDRRKAALKANMARRKTQAQARANLAAEGNTGSDADAPETDGPDTRNGMRDE